MRCCIETPINSTGTSENILDSDGPASTIDTTVKTITTTTTATSATIPSTTTIVTTASSVATLKTTSDNQKESVNRTSTKTCSGICMAERIADYCDAVLVIDTLCKPGYKCCVSRDAFGDFPPPELLVIDRTNSSRFDEKTGFSTLYKGPLSSTTMRPNMSISINVPTTTAAMTAITATYPTTTTRPKITVKKPCKGECVSGFFALLCDKVDGEAECPDDGSCCVIDAFLKTETTTTIRPTTVPPQPKLQPCAGFCLLTIMAAFCERPNVILVKTSTCQSGSICCDNTRSSSQIPRPRPRPTQKPSITTVSLPPDPRPECPGSCIVSYLSFTCFRNAELTSLFKCKKQGHQCCAPKSLIREFLGGNSSEPVLSNRNDTMYVTSRPYTTPVTTTIYETTAVTSTVRSPVYSKYVCGVKGTSRGPIQARSFERGARVVGGEDADANEWCWQVALINSLNQYLWGVRSSEHNGSSRQHTVSQTL